MNSTLKTAAMWFRLAPRVLNTTTSRTLRKCVLAMLDARMTAPEDRKPSKEANHYRDLLHHFLDGLSHIGNVDHRDRRVGVEERPLHRAYLPGIYVDRSIPDHRQTGQRQGRPAPSELQSKTSKRSFRSARY